MYHKLKMKWTAPKEGAETPDGRVYQWGVKIPAGEEIMVSDETLAKLIAAGAVDPPEKGGEGGESCDD